MPVDEIGELTAIRGDELPVDLAPHGMAVEPCSALVGATVAGRAPAVSCTARGATMARRIDEPVAALRGSGHWQFAPLAGKPCVMTSKGRAEGTRTWGDWKGETQAQMYKGRERVLYGR